MRHVEFQYIFDKDNLLRIDFELEHGEVLAFVVQLECFFEDGGWAPVVRYDTAHGFAHRDKLRPKGETDKTEMPVGTYKEGLNYAIDDLKANWQENRRRYEEWLEK